MKNIVFTFLLIFSQMIPAQIPTGNIKGTLIDTDTKAPLIGANVSIVDSHLGAATDINGEFGITNLPVGSYSLRFGYIGYKPVVKTDIIVKPGRITFVDVELASSSIETESVVVTGGYFQNTEIQPSSITSFSYEEIRRAPGSAGDVSRIMMGLPSIGKIGDQSNSLIVRGGSSTENSFYVDNIEIPNINHFPMVGTGSGPIGLLNVDFIKNVDFYSGGFSPQFGNKLSSVMDIEFREGNREEFDAQLDLSFQGIGGIIEGPLDGGKGTYFISGRRSYLDIIFDKVAEGEAMPSYYDSQAKVVYNLSKNHKISLLNIFANDNQKMTYKKAFENEKNDYFDIDIVMNSAGINWQYIWEKSGYSNFTLSHHYWKDARDIFSTLTKENVFKSASTEQGIRIRNYNHYIISKNNKLNFGFDIKYSYNNYNNDYAEKIDKLGNTPPRLIVDLSLNTTLISSFANYSWQIGNITLNKGVRAVYSDLNTKVYVEPRLSMTYDFSDITSMTGLFGVFHQNIPHVLAAQKKDFEKLDFPKSYHYILSFSHLLTEDTKLTLEIYNKEYFNLPMNPATPQLMVFDNSFFESYLESNTKLVSKGRAYARGVELTVQKKLATDIYGLIAGTYYRARYKSLDGKWLDRLYDNKFNFTIEGGYKPNESWECSARWIYSGGTPFTPFDIEASQKANTGIYDESRINAERLPDYHSLNVRVDKRFHFGKSSLVLYLSVWNAYGRKNISNYSWNEIKNEQQEEKQWTTLPIIGLEFEF